MAQIDRRYYFIGGAALLIIILLILIISTAFKSRSNISSQTSLFPQATPTLQQIPVQPTPRPIFVDGSIWRVTHIEELAYHLRGYNYDVATFVNVDTGQTLTAHCMQPKWPSPRIGDTYRLNYGGVLIPTTESSRNPHQRFLFLNYLSEP
jgi:hypothetical protein